MLLDHNSQSILFKLPQICKAKKLKRRFYQSEIEASND